jgi:hypothetical protein
MHFRLTGVLQRFTIAYREKENSGSNAVQADGVWNRGPVRLNRHSSPEIYLGKVGTGAFFIGF